MVSHARSNIFVNSIKITIFSFLVACYATLHPSCQSIRRSVYHALLFWGFCDLWPHSSCPNDHVTSNMAPAHPHANGVTVYPALLFTQHERRELIETSNHSKAYLYRQKHVRKPVLPVRPVRPFVDFLSIR